MQTETCGGHIALDIYELIHADAPTDPEYMDCYADKKKDRIMSDELFTEDMTPAVCRAHCLKSGHMYYATQVKYGMCASCRNYYALLS